MTLDEAIRQMHTIGLSTEKYAEYACFGDALRDAVWDVVEHGDRHILIAAAAFLQGAMTVNKRGVSQAMHAYWGLRARPEPEEEWRFVPSTDVLRYYVIQRASFLGGKGVQFKLVALPGNKRPDMTIRVVQPDGPPHRPIIEERTGGGK